MTAVALELQDNVMRRADERLEVAHHAVRMLRNPDYVAALQEGASPADGRPGEEALAKYL